MTDRTPTETTPADAPLVFTYRNWRGEVSTRRVQPMGIRFGSTEWHPEAQWLLRALDIDKGEEREFAMKDIAASPAAPGAEVEPVAFNINETVLVRLNDHGREIVRESDAKWSELYPRLRGHSTLPEEDADGWSKWQLWHLMKTFGPHMLAGAPNPFDITIRIPPPTTTDAIRAQARREALNDAADYAEGFAAACGSLKLRAREENDVRGAAIHGTAEEEALLIAAGLRSSDLMQGRAIAGKGEAEG